MALVTQIDRERAQRLRHLRKPEPAQVEAALNGRVADKPELREAVERGVQFATSLSYHHPGQDAATYLAHPMRVANLYLDLVEEPTSFGVVLALVHNVLEVADVTEAAVEDALGSELYDALVLLTVDRERQWDWSYKDRYYEKITNAPDEVGAVKVLDKLDNLYLLSLNADADVRAKYLEEIERWVVPLAAARVPEVVALVEELIGQSRAIGHRPLEDWTLPEA